MLDNGLMEKNRGFMVMKKYGRSLLDFINPPDRDPTNYFTATIITNIFIQMVIYSGKLLSPLGLYVKRHPSEIRLESRRY
jgi:hypothetical protein